ncbi:MAG: aminotransferase class V-fold PLP-dependent enzyme [Saprospiraceae bacterium]|nr:aminotransferase class V-fold PLP-dependent enzyme [Saprospiraceae bacterium]
MINYKLLKQEFLLDPEITYLNFGSFGACPNLIFEEYQRLQKELEKEPVQFITRVGMKLLADSRKSLAEYTHCEMDDIVYVMNPSYAVNIVAKSFNLKEGDEILATNIEYGACDRAWDYYCKKVGAKYIRQKINLPLNSKQEIVKDLFLGCNEKTRLVFISHITSSTGLKLPAKEICQEAHRRGIMCFIDGAHVPGQIPLNLQDLDADFYTGACHKWMMTPKGSSFLFVKKDYQSMCEPLIVSWGYEALFPSESLFQDWHTIQGSRDFSAFLTIPKSIQFMQDNQWDKVAARNRSLVQSNAVRFLNLLEAEPICPISDEYLAQMFSIPIKAKEPENFYNHLFNNYKIEIPVMRQDDKLYLRYSIQAFNDQNDLDRLYEVLSIEKKSGTFII